jgi:hypothetical protein
VNGDIVPDFVGAASRLLTTSRSEPVTSYVFGPRTREARSAGLEAAQLPGAGAEGRARGRPVRDQAKKRAEELLDEAFITR